MSARAPWTGVYASSGLAPMCGPIQTRPMFGAIGRVDTDL
jgi:hypothetical protein